jgi:hypothetical protein
MELACANPRSVPAWLPFHRPCFPHRRFWGASELSIWKLIGSINTSALSVLIDGRTDNFRLAVIRAEA